MFKVIKKYLVSKKKKQFNKNLRDLLNLIIVTKNFDKNDLDSKKVLVSPTSIVLAYTETYERLSEKCIGFKDIENKDPLDSAFYSLLHGIFMLFNGEYKKALKSINGALLVIQTIDNDFVEEARYLHYLSTIVLTQTIGQEIYEILENKISVDKDVQNQLHKKIEQSDLLLDKINNGAYNSLNEKDKQSSILRILENQKKVFFELYNIELEMKNYILQDEFMDLMATLDDNLNFIEKEMLENNFLFVEDIDDIKLILPKNHISDIIYIYLQIERMKLSFYKNDLVKFNELFELFLQHTNYTNWENPFNIVKNGNKHENIAAIQCISRLKMFNSYIDEASDEKEKYSREWD